MRWTFIPADPTALPEGNRDYKWEDHIIIDEMTGEDIGISYLSDVAVWYADNNIRNGYDFFIEGGCFKGPYALQWKQIIIVFEEDPAVALLVEHLTAQWGAQGEQLGEIGIARLDRIE